MYNNRKEIILHSSIFVFISFYILSSSANILLFHFIIDINLAKIGMLVAFVGLIPYTYKDILKRWTEQKTMIIFIFFWALYLLLNSYFSLYPIISLKFILRIIGCWLIAFQIGIILTKYDCKYHNTIMNSLLFTFLIITLVWNLDLRAKETLVWFTQKMPNRSYWRLTGLYINPNELGYALVIHSLLLIWFVKERILFLLLILPLAFWGVYLSGSRNSFLALMIVTVFSLFVSFKRWMVHHRLTKIKVYSIFFVILFASTFLANQFLPSRVKRTLNLYANQIEITDPMKTVSKIYNRLGLRKQIYDFAIDTWKDHKWVGIGIGSFSPHQRFGQGFNTHNFLLSVLVEQGLIGIVFILIFSIMMIIYMKSWTGSMMLVLFPLTLIFDDLSWSYIFPVYLSILLGICFYYSYDNLQRDKPIIYLNN
jgi:O-antigen ligase|tara:strand:- start:64 stop:1335 length:1272 start_codon:yes stop_codon:yes gene_type:complete